jgi:hypothetical protein
MRSQNRQAERKQIQPRGDARALAGSRRLWQQRKGSELGPGQEWPLKMLQAEQEARQRRCTRTRCCSTGSTAPLGHDRIATNMHDLYHAAAQRVVGAVGAMVSSMDSGMICSSAIASLCAIYTKRFKRDLKGTQWSFSDNSKARRIRRYSLAGAFAFSSSMCSCRISETPCIVSYRQV